MDFTMDFTMRHPLLSVVTLVPVVVASSSVAFSSVASSSVVSASMVSASSGSSALSEVSSLSRTDSRMVEAVDLRPVGLAEVDDDLALAADLAILKKLDEPFSEPKSFRNADAGAVVALVREATGLPIEIDRQIVGESGGWEFASVDCEAATPRVALDAVARAISTSYRSMVLEVVAGIAIFTDNDRASRITAIRRYDLGPILTRLDPVDANPAGRRTKVADMLVEAIDPEGWRENGGEVSWLQSVDEILVVSTTPSRHHAIGRFLDGLGRSLSTPTLRWSITVAEVDASVSEADLALVLDSAAELEALVALGGARITARPTLVALRHKEARVSVERSANERTGQAAESLAVTVKPVPEVATFAVHVEERGAAGVRAITLRAVEGVRSAGMIDVEGRRMLVSVVAEAMEPAEPKARTSDMENGAPPAEIQPEAAQGPR